MQFRNADRRFDNARLAKISVGRSCLRGNLVFLVSFPELTSTQVVFNEFALSFFIQFVRGTGRCQKPSVFFKIGNCEKRKVSKSV